MVKLILEVGSTCTKIDKLEDGRIQHLETITIFFKKHYLEKQKLDETDVEKLIRKIEELKQITKDIYVCGTSIFRTLSEEEKNTFLTEFKKKTNLDFAIISQEKENQLTVIRAIKHVKQKVAVLIGGGGSTEISIYDQKIKEMINSPIGVMDIMKAFPDLGENLAVTDLEEVKKYIKKKINIPKQKADILILAGGGHAYFAKNAGIYYEKNTLYEDPMEPIKMDIEIRRQDTERYYKQIALDDIRRRVEDPDWWYATRAMCALVLVIAEAIEAKYIVPTDISMVYGLIDEIERTMKKCN